VRSVQFNRPPFTAVINKSHAWAIDLETGEPQPLDGPSAYPRSYTVNSAKNKNYKTWQSWQS
jgi:hypothetical protein